MRKLKTIPLALFALVMLALAASPAGATPPTGYGFDGTPQAIAGGGSDTTYKVMLALSDLYNEAPGCAQLTAVGPSLAQCDPTSSPVSGQPIGNWDHDVVSQTFGVGSSAGIASLNGFAGTQASVTYPSTINPVPGYTGSTSTGPNVDFARSSRTPKTSGGQSTSGNELTSDTFWGFANDGVEVTVFNNRHNNTDAAASASPAGLTFNELFNIYNCTYTQWSQVPSLGITPGGAGDGPIVAWGMNPSSGTYGTFNTAVANGSGNPSFTANAGACVKKLSAAAGGLYPLENDIKPLLNDVNINAGGLSTDPASVNNPENWIWWGSFGVFSAFPYTSSLAVTTGTTTTTYSAFAAPINGIKPATSNIGAGTYPISRTLYHVTRKPDADCPKNTSGACDFVNNPGPAITSTVNDLNVAGGGTGVTQAGQAVREFTRWLCRSGAARQTIDPFSGKNYAVAINGAIAGAGFTLPPATARTAGSNCVVLS